MKRFLSLALVLVMLASVLVIPVNAADPYGTVVEAQYAAEAPDMSESLPDASWGEKVAHIDKNSPNAGVTQYGKNHYGASATISEDICFDAYMRWTDESLYLCFVSPNEEYVGVYSDGGDGYQIDIIYGITDISHYDADLAENKNDYDMNYTYVFSADGDDYSSSGWFGGEDINFMQYWDEKAAVVVLKAEFPFAKIGASKKDLESLEGTYCSFVMLCIDFLRDDYPQGVGWLEWGDFFNREKGFKVPAGEEDFYYNPGSLNLKTTTANSIKLVGKSGGTASYPPVSPETTDGKVTLKGTPSSWAKAEVEAALEAGLIPEELTDGFTNGISRANLSKILSKLLDKVYGKNAEKSDAKFTDTTDADVLKAANLGIINGYEQTDGTFMFKPDNTLKRSEMAAIINRVAKLCGQTVTGFDSEVTFTDTASHWCKGELGWPVHNGIVKGTSDTTFSPENTLTVEQTIMMIYRTYEALK